MNSPTTRLNHTLVVPNSFAPLVDLGVVGPEVRSTFFSLCKKCLRHSANCSESDGESCSESDNESDSEFALGLQRVCIRSALSLQRVCIESSVCLVGSGIVMFALWGRRNVRRAAED